MMKVNILSFLFILFSVSLFAQKAHSAKDLIGKWEGKDTRNEVGGLIFQKDNKAIVVAPGQEFSANELYHWFYN